MGGRRLSISGAVVTAVVVGAVLYFEFRTPSGADERDRLVGELRTFMMFEEHETLLMEVVEQEHDAVVAGNMGRKRIGGRSHRYLDEDGYRIDMYRRLCDALAEAGFSEAAVRLEQHRARQ